ncbi:MAG: DUF2235 domain-containing protein [Acidobacteria bacterium]|nr:DUF2235 domain-containing protein [Acidobacteriota bacterium]
MFADRAVPVLERQLEASRLDDFADLERPLLPEGTAVVVVGIDLPPPWDLTLITVQTGILRTWHPPLLLPGEYGCPSEIVSGLKTAYPGIFPENESYARDLSLVSDWNTSAWIHVLRTTMMGLIEHRFYSPRLGHFLTPDFRLPDIYDPSSFTEPYAYASANPLMFWDPDGLSGWFFDGTWNDKDNPNFDKTNIAVLWELYQRRKFYINGSGASLPGESPLIDTSRYTPKAFGYEVRGVLPYATEDTLYHGFTGYDVEDRVLYQFNEFKNYYRGEIEKALAGDPNADLEVDVFGFSRGSVTATSFISLIWNEGVDFTYQGKTFNFKPNIRFLGLFDSVGSTGIPGNDEEIPIVDTTLAPNVQIARHLYAFDEKRWKFGLYRIEDLQNQIWIQKSGQRRLPRLLEVGGPGYHFDVGGTGSQLSNTYLNIMSRWAVEAGVPLSRPASFLASGYDPNVYAHQKVDSEKSFMYWIDVQRREHPQLADAISYPLTRKPGSVPPTRNVRFRNAERWRVNPDARVRGTIEWNNSKLLSHGYYD